MQPPSLRFFITFLAQFNHANTHKTLLGFQPFDHPICNLLQLVSSLEFNTIQSCKYPQNFTWISAIWSPYMQPPSACFFTRVSAQCSHTNIHKTSLGFQPFDYPICSHLQLVSSLEFQHNSAMQIPTKLHLDFSHSITLYAVTFNSFLY